MPVGGVIRLACAEAAKAKPSTLVNRTCFLFIRHVGEKSSKPFNRTNLHMLCQSWLCPQHFCKSLVIKGVMDRDRVGSLTARGQCVNYSDKPLPEAVFSGCCKSLSLSALRLQAAVRFFARFSDKLLFSRRRTIAEHGGGSLGRVWSRQRDSLFGADLGGIGDCFSDYSAQHVLPATINPLGEAPSMFVWKPKELVLATENRCKVSRLPTTLQSHPLSEHRLQGVVARKNSCLEAGPF